MKILDIQNLDIFEDISNVEGQSLNGQDGSSSTTITGNGFGFAFGSSPFGFFGSFGSPLGFGSPVLTSPFPSSPF
ncbi:hypothetical protein Xen7305DRAFT_00041760 [Xenococcus sp. PCC 7305]|uniref:hypothetical protein n=1 Tax=Xenococcus sp. PCC 7305 TaxID=102125 RepID=UPI0002AD112F|nr:hypothetical protein [Xenococcus sp. PCC 7305]ELS04442.1 hypothetical protein Xen7305DRAFT_00041760 [Xenococcus sp. PCC 7305]